MMNWIIIYFRIIMKSALALERILQYQVPNQVLIKSFFYFVYSEMKKKLLSISTHTHAHTYKHNFLVIFVIYVILEI